MWRACLCFPAQEQMRKFWNVKTEPLSTKWWAVYRWNIIFWVFKKALLTKRWRWFLTCAVREIKPPKARTCRPIKKPFLSHLSSEFRLAPYCGFTKTGYLGIYPCNPPKSVNETYVFRTKPHFLRKWTACYSQAPAVGGLAASQLPWAEVEPDDGLDWKPRPSKLLCSPPTRENVSGGGKERRGEQKMRANENVKHVGAKREQSNKKQERWRGSELQYNKKRWWQKRKEGRIKEGR